MKKIMGKSRRCFWGAGVALAGLCMAFVFSANLHSQGAQANRPAQGGQGRGQAQAAQDPERAGADAERVPKLPNCRRASMTHT